MEKKEIIRKTLCILFSFLLSVTLFVMTVTAAMRFTLLDKGFFTDTLEKSGYTELLRARIADELAEYGYVAGFDEKFFGSVITYEDVNTPVLSSVDAIYSEGEYQAPNAEKFSEKLLSAFLNNLSERGVEITEELKASLDELARQCAEFYASNARLPFISIMQTLVDRADRLADYALIFLAAFSVFAVLLILFINPERLNTLRYLSYAFGGAGLMTVTPPAAMLITGVLKKISIRDEALYTLVQTAGHSIVSLVLWAAIGLIVCSVISAVVFITKQNPNHEH